MQKRLLNPLFFCVASLLLLASCSNSRYGHLSYVKANPQAKSQARIKQKRIPPAIALLPAATANTPPAAQIIVAAPGGTKNNVNDAKINTTSAPRVSKATVKELKTDDIKSANAITAQTADDDTKSEGSALKVLGWILIIIGFIFLLVISILLGALMMLLGLVFVLAGK